MLAAAEVLGTRLRRLYPVRERGSLRDDIIHLHNDSHHVAVNVHGRITTLRDPDEDYLLIQCVRRAASGGSSIVADGGGWPPQRGWHGRDPHDTPRLVRILTVRTTGAM